MTLLLDFGDEFIMIDDDDLEEWGGWKATH